MKCPIVHHLWNRINLQVEDVILVSKARPDSSKLTIEFLHGSNRSVGDLGKIQHLRIASAAHTD